MMSKQTVLRLMATLLVFIAILTATLLYYQLPRTYRVAVGPEGSPQVGYVRAIARAMADSRQSFRFEVVVTSGSIASSALLDARKVDLAVLRSDDTTSKEARSLVILHRRAVLIAARHDLNIKSLTDLRGHSVAVLSGESDSNLPVIRTIMSHYGLGTQDVNLVEMPFSEVTEALRDRKVDAFVIVAYPGGGRPRMMIGDLIERMKIPLDLSAPPAPEALAFRFKDLEVIDLPAGVFGGTPPKPEHAIKSVAITYELTAGSRLSEYDGSSLVKVLMELRGKLRRGVELPFTIETPSLDADRRFLPHPATIAYVNATAKSLLETYSDQIWLGIFIFSLLGSSVTALLSWIGIRKEPESKGIAHRVPELIRKLDEAGSVEDIDQISREVEDIVKAVIHDYATGRIDAEEPDPGRWISLLQGLIEIRRARLAQANPVL